VILEKSGKSEEARHAFEEAVRIEPDMPDANWNLTHRPLDFWTQMHQKYAPDAPMIAPPSRPHLLRAFGVDTPFRLGLHALTGPFASYRLLRSNPQIGLPGLINFQFTLIVVLLSVGLLAVFAIPARDVTQPPYRSQRILEYLFPGTGPGWYYGAGIVLVAWTLFGLDLLAAAAGWRFFGIGVPNINRTFAVPVSVQSGTIAKITAPYAVAGLVFLYVVNTVLVWHSQKNR